MRWNATFDTFVWPLLGFIVAPWTTLAYVAVYPAGINGFDFVWLGLAIAVDVFSWFGGAYTNRVLDAGLRHLRGSRPGRSRTSER